MVTPFLVVQNDSYSTLATAVTAVTTSWPVADGSKFPTDYPYDVTNEDEIARVTNNAGNVLTVTRAVQGTIAAAHKLGTAVCLNATAKSVTDLNTAVNALEAVAGDGELRLTPKASSSGPEGTMFYDSDDDHVYVGTE